MSWKVKLKVITNIWPGFLKNVFKAKINSELLKI